MGDDDFRESRRAEEWEDVQKELILVLVSALKPIAMM